MVGVKKKVNLRGIVFVSVLLIATVIRFYLVSKAQYYITTEAEFDDQLYLNYAKHLLNGDWLGSYNNTTLAKGISYALFIGVANKLQLAYSTLLGILLVFSSWIVSSVFFQVSRNRYFQLVVYLYFLYSPITFVTEYSIWIYRNALVVPLVSLVIASVIGIYFSRTSFKQMSKWSVLLTVVFPFYWFLREDSIWLLPFVVVGLLFTAVCLFLEQRTKASVLPRSKKLVLVQLLCLLLPFISLTLARQIIIYENQTHYGVALVNDRTGGSFGQLMERLIRLDDGTKKDDARVWVSQSQLKKAEQVSPTLRTLSKEIDWIYQASPWSAGGTVTGDIIFWALRDAAERGGYYHDAKITERFWQKVVVELDQAYASNKLKEKNELYVSKTGDGKQSKDLPIVVDFMKTGLTYNLFYTDLAQTEKASTGKDTLIKSDERILKLKLAKKVNSSSKIAQIADKIIRAYQLTAFLFIGTAVLGLLFMVDGLLSAKITGQLFSQYLLIGSGLFLTYLLFLFGIAWFCSWDPSREDVFMRTYSGAGITILQFGLCWSALGLFKRKGMNKKFF